MSLRRRVLLGWVAVAVVLLLADVALAGTFRGFLLDQADEQLAESSVRLAAFAAGPGGRFRDGLPGQGRGEALSEFYVAVADADGNLLGRVDVPLRAGRDAPEVPPEDVRDHATRLRGPLDPFTATAPDGGRWRIAAVQPRPQGPIVLIGVSLDAADTTLGRMIAVLAAATLTVLVTLALVAWWVLRQGVRPLTAMTATAESIAGGALHERVDDVDVRTEAGRLGAALNTMLARIERAFAERAASEERLRRFVADASHELRTPLTSIRGYAELYRSGALADEPSLDGAMRRIEQEATRMGVLVDDLLLLAELDQGRPLDVGPVDLARIARDAVADLRAVQPDRPVTLRATSAVVTGDEARLRQALGNLLANVRVHTPPRTAVTVTVGVEDGHAVVEVADGGPGMPEQVAAHVFERFYRADSSRVRPGGGAQGSGLGLAIVAGIVEAHGGRVSVVSAPGRGSTFRIVLPLAGGGDGVG